MRGVCGGGGGGGPERGGEWGGGGGGQRYRSRMRIVTVWLECKAAGDQTLRGCAREGTEADQRSYALDATCCW